MTAEKQRALRALADDILLDCKIELARPKREILAVALGLDAKIDPCPSIGQQQLKRAFHSCFALSERLSYSNVFSWDELQKLRQWQPPWTRYNCDCCHIQCKEKTYCE